MLLLKQPNKIIELDLSNNKLGEGSDFEEMDEESKK